MTRTTRLDQHAVVTAAMALVDADGLDALSMRRLSAALGVETMSLYRYVVDKQALIDLLIDRLYDEFELPDVSGDRGERIGAYCRAMRAALLRHPGLVPLAATRPVMSTATMGLVEVCLAELSEMGFEAETARRVLAVVVSFVMGHVLTEVGELPAIGGYDADAVGRFRAALGVDRFPLAAASIGARAPDRDAEFELGIRVLVTGLEAELIADRPSDR